ncbi:transposase, partial [Thiolapillus sp.]|uniref:transposase n=1 Tax=Thiolapillus sp. TaxID=2017437 RepID=UPI003AF515FD
MFDHFHVIKLFNEKLTKLRRDLQREAEAGLGKPVLKGIRWPLLKNPDNLDDTRDERQRLNEALKLNEPLATAYYMKEELRQIWRQSDKAPAEKALAEWIAKAAASNVGMLQQFAKTLAAHRSGILAYYDFDGLSTGTLEGTNNKIKTLHKMAYGFRDTEFFKLKIMALHETRYPLTCPALSTHLTDEPKFNSNCRNWMHILISTTISCRSRTGKMKLVSGYKAYQASALLWPVCLIGNGENYRRGRDVSAAVGLVPKQHSS